VPVDPSPKFQVKEYGTVPPEAEAVNVTCWPVVGEAGLKVKLAVSDGGGGLVTVTAFWDAAVCWGELLSLTVRATLYEPAFV